MKIWLIFCGVIELVFWSITDYLNINILQLELFKVILYLLFFILLNIFMKIKKWENKIKSIMNIGVSLLLSSLSGVLSLGFVLKAEGRGEGIFIMVTYGVSVILLLLWMRKREINNSEVDNVTESSSLTKGVTGIGILSTIAFIRVASDEQTIAFFGLILIVLIWLFLVIGFASIKKCRDELSENMLNG